MLNIDFFDFGEDAKVGAELLGDGAEGGYVLGEAGASVADARAEEAWPDAAVEPDAAGDLFDVSLSGLAEIGDGIDEGDLHGEEGIRGVLDDLRAFGGGEEERGRMGDRAGSGDGFGLLVVLAGGEGSVDEAEEIGSAGVVGADDYAVGVEKIGDGRAFAEEFGVGDDVEELVVNTVALDGTTNPLVGIDGDGAFFDDDFVGVEGAGDFAGYGFDVGEVGVTVLTLGGSDGDKDGLCGESGLGEIGGEADAGVAVAGEEIAEEKLVDLGIAGLEGGDFGLVVIDADDLMAHLREANGGDEADVS